MPSYDYSCSSCNYHFEEFQNMSDAVLTTCPQCGKESLRRHIGGGLGVIFKGSGFYVTDNKSSKSSANKISSKNSSANTKESKSSESTSKKEAVSSSKESSNG
jgi:putative FmdB family regulatory protein